MNNVLIATIITLSLATQSIFAGEPSRNQIKRFVMQVSTGPEYGSDKKAVSRWSQAPTVSIFGANPDQKAIVEEVFRTIGPILSPKIGDAVMLPDNSAGASMRIYFAKQKDLKKIAKDHDVKYNDDDWGFFWVFWDAKNVIQSSIVLLATDKIKDNKLKHYAFEEIIQSFGLAEDSTEFPDSIFYEKSGDGGNATHPSAMDLQLLDWFYQNLTPGDTRKIVSEKFDLTWPKSK